MIVSLNPERVIRDFVSDMIVFDEDGEIDGDGNLSGAISSVVFSIDGVNPSTSIYQKVLSAARSNLKDNGRGSPSGVDEFTRRVLEIIEEHRG